MNIINKLYKLRPLLEKEIGSVVDTTKWLERVSYDIKNEPPLYAISCLSAFIFLSKQEKLKKELTKIIEVLYVQNKN